MKGEIQVTDGDGNHAPEPARRPVDDALDRLARLADRAPERTVYAREKDMEAAATVREALEQLREERPRRVTVTIDAEVATQAALMAAEAEAERLREEKGDWVRIAAEQEERAKSVEVEVRRLTEGLRKIEQYRYPLNGMLDAIIAIKKIARALLAASPSDGGGAITGNIVERVNRAARAFDREPDGGGAGVHSADPTKVTPKMMRDAGRGTVGGGGS